MQTLEQFDQYRYHYNAHLLRVVDGDTVQLQIDLGCSVSIKMTVRLSGINAPEMKTPEGKASREALIKLFVERAPNTVPLRIVTEKDKTEKYGRYLATIFFPNLDGTLVNVNEWMIESGWAKESKY